MGNVEAGRAKRRKWISIIWPHQTSIYTKVHTLGDQLPFNDNSLISMGSTFVLKEFCSCLFCILSSSSLSSCCRILIFASITCCSSYRISRKCELRHIQYRNIWIEVLHNLNEAFTYNLLKALLFLCFHTSVFHSVIRGFAKRASHEVK